MSLKEPDFLVMHFKTTAPAKKFLSFHTLMQAAQGLAQLASRHAHDKKYPSPYSQEAVKQGIDLPWFLKLANSSFSDGKFRLGHMKVSTILAADFQHCTMSVLVLSA